MFCSECGAKLVEGARFCEECKTEVANTAQTPGGDQGGVQTTAVEILLMQ